MMYPLFGLWEFGGKRKGNKNNNIGWFQARMKISILMDISILKFYRYIGYIGDISVDIFT